MVTRPRGSPTILVALVAISLLTVPVASASSVGTTVADGAVQASKHGPTNETVPTADEVYVADGGDAILVYRTSETVDQTTRGHYGVDVAEGLLHVLIEGDAGSTDATGNASFVLDPDELRGDADFQIPKPESIDTLDFDASMTQTNETSEGQASLDATFATEQRSAASMTSSVSTEGSIVTTASSFQTTGSVNVTTSSAQAENQERSYTLEETDDGYVLDASVRRQLSRNEVDRYDTEEKARDALEAQYGQVSAQLGGDADVTLSSYEFVESDSDAPVLDVEFRVEYTGVDEALSNQVARSLMEARDLDVTEEQATRIGAAVTEVHVDRVHASLDVDDTSVAASWDVEISNYDEVAIASLDVAESASQHENVTEMVERARTRYEAQRESNLRTEMTWAASVSTADRTASVDATTSYNTENWDAYVEALAERGSMTPGSFTFEASAETVEGELVTNVTASFRQDDLVEQTIKGFTRSAENSTANPELEAFVNAFQQASYERSRLDVSLQNGSVSLEAAASFRNITAFESAIEEEYPNVSIASIYGEYEGRETMNYVRVPGAFDDDPTEDEVREHRAVGEDTTIHLPDEWDADERDFPEPNETAIREYLGVTEDDTNSPGMPGFGVPAAIAALVGLALIGSLARRREEY